MAQHDYVIANDTAANVRADINNALAAVVSNNSGATQPTTMYANEWWYDTATDTLKIRAEANDAWISVALLNQTTDQAFPIVGGVTVTSTGTELNLLDSAAAGTIVNSKAVVYGAAGQVNATTLQIAGTSITATAAELNTLDGITATVTELNYTDGVTSAIQTQLNAKAALASPTFTGTPAAPTATAGTNTTQVATTAFVQAALGGAASYTLLGTINTTSGTSQTLSGLTLTDYTAMVLEFNDVNVSSSLTNFNLRINSTTGPTISENWSGITTDGWFGIMTIMLSTGVFSSMLAVSATVPTSSQGEVWAGDCNVTTASTSVTIALSNNSFAAGSIRVYGVK